MLIQCPCRTSPCSYIGLAVSEEAKAWLRSTGFRLSLVLECFPMDFLVKKGDGDEVAVTYLHMEVKAQHLVGDKYLDDQVCFSL